MTMFFKLLPHSIIHSLESLQTHLRQSQRSGLGVYWFFNALFTMTQSIVIHKIILDRRAKGVTIESKLTKLGIE